MTLALNLALTLAIPACGPPPEAAAATPHPPLGWVAVRLDGADRVGVRGPFVVVDDRDQERARGPSLPEDAALALEDGLVTVGGQPLGPPPVEIRPAEGAAVSVNGRPYRGLLRLEAGGSDAADLRVLNRLPVDDYLRGVLPAEMPDRFGLEALRAQAVAARSYALSEVARRGWLHADVRSQAYGGREAETWITSRAVEDMLGQVLAHAGRVIPAWFYSTCGGATTPAGAVYDDPPEGVLEHGIRCPDCRHSPTYAWERWVDADRVCAAAGLPPAPLTAVSVAPERFPGRPRTVTVEAGGRTATVSAGRFRSRLSVGRPFDEQLLSTRWHAPGRVEGGALVVRGAGWGHGVGLCQYGAAGYAERGAGYRAILRRYYPGAELVRLQ